MQKAGKIRHVVRFPILARCESLRPQGIDHLPLNGPSGRQERQQLLTHPASLAATQNHTHLGAWAELGEPEHIHRAAVHKNQILRLRVDADLLRNGDSLRMEHLVAGLRQQGIQNRIPNQAPQAEGQAAAGDIDLAGLVQLLGLHLGAGQEMAHQGPGITAQPLIQHLRICCKSPDTGGDPKLAESQRALEDTNPAGWQTQQAQDVLHIGEEILAMIQPFGHKEHHICV